MAMKKPLNGIPEILTVSPEAAIPGGEFRIRGRRLARNGLSEVMIGEEAAPVLVGSDELVIARVPEGAVVGEVTVSNGSEVSAPWGCDIGLPVADSLHMVASPAVDAKGNIFATLSGSRGQKTPVAVFKIDLNYDMQPFVTDLMNATGLAFDRKGLLYVSSRQDGTVYQVTERGDLSIYIEGMGVATGVTFDAEQNLYVGDRSGTIFKVSPERQIYVFTTLEPSISGYHLAFGTDGYLYVTGPTTSSFDCVYRVSSEGDSEIYYRGLGRPQGLAFDIAGNLYVAASLRGHRGIVRITPARDAQLFVSGPDIVGLAFTPSRYMIVATNSTLFRLDVEIQGQPPL